MPGMETEQPRLNVRTLRPRDVILSIPTPCSVCRNDPQQRESCSACGREGLVDVDYEIKGTLGVSHILALLDVNDEIQAAKTTPQLTKALVSANRVVNSIIQENNPAAPEFSFTLDEIIGPGGEGGILGFLVRNRRGPAAEVAEALASGMPEPGSEESARLEEAAARGLLSDPEERRDEDGSLIPLRSPSASPADSSISGSVTVGARNGGETSPGAPAAPTSITPTAVS